MNLSKGKLSVYDMSTWIINVLTYYLIWQICHDKVVINVYMKPESLGPLNREGYNNTQSTL